MRSSWKKRIINALVIVIFLFITECVFTKLIFDQEDWLSFSLINSISLLVGFFISETITTKHKSIWKIISIDLKIIFIAFIMLAFVLGVVCDMKNWGEITCNILVPFGLSMIINNNWK